jgi:hypothetical protein
VLASSRTLLQQLRLQLQRLPQLQQRRSKTAKQNNINTGCASLLTLFFFPILPIKYKKIG